MKKIVILSSLVMLGALAGSNQTSAYGGGGGFPPGYFNNPNAKPGLVCEWVTLDLPANVEVTVPRCRVERNEKQANNFSERVDKFVSKVVNGNR